MPGRALKRSGCRTLTLRLTSSVQRAIAERGLVTGTRCCGLLAITMRWAKIFLYIYFAQAALGTAIGLAVPFLHLIVG